MPGRSGNHVSRDRELLAPPGCAESLGYAADLKQVRRFVADGGSKAGLADDRVTDLVLAVCLRVHREAGSCQLLLQPSVLPFQRRDLLIARITGLTAAGLGQRRERPGAPGAPPLGDVTGIQALPPQDRTFSPAAAAS